MTKLFLTEFILYTLVIFHFAAHSVDLQQMPEVDISQFSQGNKWVWLYSKKGNAGDWEDYYFEQYLVTEVKDSFVTIEMSSWPKGGSAGESHHSFIVDLRQCGKKGLTPAAREFGIQFFKRSEDDSRSWVLVSKTFLNASFTEKFNCFSRIGREPVLKRSHRVSSGMVDSLRLKYPATPAGNSEYILNDGSLQGVAVYKLFHPKKIYQFKLLVHP